MNNKRHFFLGIAMLSLISLAIIRTVSAGSAPPPCLTTNLCFENAIKVTNFTGASDLAVGYINPGGNLDFVTTGWSRDKIRLKAGLGDGTFWGTWTKNMGDGTHEVDIADFNNDGYTDIIATNSEQDQVYIRWGLSGWTNATTWTTDDHPHYVAAGDLNNDGLDDFATGNTSAGYDSVTVRLRQDGGGFDPGTDYPVQNDFIGDITFNDCDHDGDLDMFYSAVFTDPYDQEALVYLRLNDGLGSFAAAWGIDLDSKMYGITVGTIAFGDLNEDGWYDFVVTRSDHKIIRVLGGMNCSFHDPIVADVQSNPYRVAIADMNGDGHLDIVVSHILQQLITIYLGQGNGEVTGPYEPELTLDWSVRDIGVGDFNNDGLMDIVYAEESGVWLLLAREPNSPPGTPPWLEVNGIPYVPAGGAQAYTINDTIIINGIGSSGDDGVDLLLDSASLWSADIDIEGYLGSKLIFDAVANETSAGSVQMVSTQSGMEIWPVINSTNYMIEYLLEDQVQLALTLPSNSPTPAAILHWDPNWCVMNMPPGDPPDTCPITFQASVEGGVGDTPLGDSLLWYDGFVIYDLQVTAGNGNLVIADHIRMAEIPDGQGGLVANGFSRMELRGAVLETVTLEEVIVVTAEAPLPAQTNTKVRSWNSQNGPYFTIFNLDEPSVIPNIAPFPTNAIHAGVYINGLSYMIDDANNLYGVDDSGALHNQSLATAPPNGETYSGMALDPTDGTVYAVSTNFNTSSLFTFDVTTGNANLIGAISGSTGIVAIAVDGNGGLYGLETTSLAYIRIDPASAEVLDIFPLPFNAGLEGGMDYDPETGLMIMLAYNDATSRGELWTVDTSNPAAPVFNFVEVLGISSPGGSNQLTWAGINLGVSANYLLYLPIMLHGD